MNSSPLLLFLLCVQSPVGDSGLELGATPPGQDKPEKVQEFLRGADAFVEETRVLASFTGEAAGDEFGWVARSLGDLDGDGVQDFGATAPSKALGGAQAGRIYVHSSREGKLLYTLDGKPGWRLGNSIAGRVDVDGDGDLDVLIGAPGVGQVAGRVLVVDGASGELLRELSAGEDSDQFGMMVCGLEDIDGDGCAEVVVGAPNADAGGKDAGRVYIYSGKSGELIHAIDGDRPGDQFGSAVDGTLSGGSALLAVGAMKAPGGGSAVVLKCSAKEAEWIFEFEPDVTASNLGQYFVTILGDVDSDGIPDVFASDFGNRANGPSTGRVYVRSGATGEPLLTLTGHGNGEGFGTSSSHCGDVNGDGVADLIVGAWQHASAAPSAGAVYLYSGVDGAQLASWTSRQTGDTLGFDAVGLGDVDGDGGVDFLLTAAWSGVRGPRTGRVWIVAGPVFE